MAELAAAYVSLLPSLRGAGKEVDKGLNSPDVKRAADRAGTSLGVGMSAGIGAAVGTAAVELAARAGQAIAKGVGDAIEREKLGDKTAASLGLSEKQSAKAGKVAGKLYAGAYGESMAETTDAVEQVISSIDGMSKATPKRLEKVTASVLDIASAFEVDVESAATNVGILMKNGLAKDAVQASDLITASLQRVPKALRGEVMDATQEYSQFFADLGFTGAQSLGLLVSATEDGQYGVDKMGDAIKEFTIRSTDMSKATDDAYESLGLNTKTMTNDLLAGGDTARAAFTTIIDGLKGIKDPGKQAEAAIALFGTPLEDLGTNEIPQFLAGLTSTKTSLGDVSGAAADMGKTLNSNLGTMWTSLTRRAQVFVSDGLIAMYQGFQQGETSGSGLTRVLTTVGATVRSATTWLQENKATVQLVAAVVAGMAGAWLVMNAAVIATRVPMMLATAAQWAMNAALAANPIGLVVIAIGALVGALVWLYQNNETVRRVIDAVWAGIKIAIGATVDWITGTAWPALQAAWTAIGAGARWLYENVIRPVWNGIQTAIQVAWTVIRVIFVTFAAAFSLMWRGIQLVWSKTGAPLFAAMRVLIGMAWSWIRDKVFTPMQIGWRALLLGMAIIKRTVLDPMWAGIKAVARAAWGFLNAAVFIPLKAAWTAVGQAFQWVHLRVITPVWNGIKTAASAAWSWIRDKAFAPMRKGVDAIGKLFESTKRIIAAAWNGIKRAAAEPINFLIETVYTKGIKATWDKIAKSVGLDLALPTVRPIAYANGGVENHTAQIARAGAMRLWAEPETGGEAYIPLAPGKRGRSTAILADVASRFGYGLTQFADGGVWGWAGDLWDSAKAKAASVAKVLSNPVGALTSMITNPMKSVLGNIGGGSIGKIAAQLPKQAVDSLIEKVKGLVSSVAPSGGSPAGAMGWQNMWRIVSGAFPGASLNSAFRPGAITAVGTPSYHGQGRAIDVSPSMAIFNWIAKNFPNSSELIYSPAGGRQLYNGRQTLFGEPTRSDHFDHVHWAMANGGVLPKLYDQGGWMPSGGVGVNLSGKPEAVLTPDESRALKAGLTQRPAPRITINTTRVSTRDVLFALDLADLHDVGAPA